MKSNQERSNECLPPKKRDMACNMPSEEQRPLATAHGCDGQRSENLAWFASVASGHNSRHEGEGQRAGDLDGPLYKPLVSALTDASAASRSAVSSLSTIYTSPLSQHAAGGTIHYTHLPSSLQFVSPPYASAGHGPYAGYISSQLLPPPPPPPPFAPAPSSHRLAESPSYPSPALSSKMDQARSAGRGPPASEPPGPQQYVQVSPLSVTPRTAPSSHGGPLHPHHTLALSGQMLVQYADGAPRKEEGLSRARELLNGDLEKGARRFESGKLGSKGNSTSSSSSSSSSSPHFHQQSTHHYEARHIVLPSDFTTQDPSGLRTSLMLVPNSHAADDHPHHHHHHHLHHRPHHHAAGSPDKLPGSGTHQEKGGIVLGKPITRAPSSFSFPPPLSVESLKAAVGALSPHTVIQTTHSATEPLSMGLPSTTYYPQPSIIGYIAGGGGGQQQSMGYHTGLGQHLLLPGAQPVIIPVSGGGVASLEAAAAAGGGHTGAVSSATFPAHTYVAAAPKGEPFEGAAPHFAHPAAVVQAQLHLPVVHAPPGLLATPPAAAAPPPSLPPYFVKGSIIQLADGELKRVEDLKTEDFIQSAEISSELKIDSSTVERIDGSPTPNFAVVQFSVGEHRAQVSVEVLAEYPFFVFGQGWSSCCPDRTTQLLELPCTKLSVGDVCISLTLRNLRNGSLKKAQSLELHAQVTAAACSPSHGQLKPLKSGAPRGGGAGGDGGCTRHRGERENGVGQQRSAGSGGAPVHTENGELGMGEKGLPPKGNPEAGAKPGGRKRRWSAPEGRKVERTEEEPPLTLPKPSFIPQEVKICIEGRSNIGK